MCRRWPDVWATISKQTNKNKCQLHQGAICRKAVDFRTEITCSWHYMENKHCSFPVNTLIASSPSATPLINSQIECLLKIWADTNMQGQRDKNPREFGGGSLETLYFIAETFCCKQRSQWVGVSRRAGKEGWSLFGQNRWSGRQRSSGTVMGWPESELWRQRHVCNRKIRRCLLKMHLRISALYREPELIPAGVWPGRNNFRRAALPPVKTGKTRFRV